MSNVSGASSGSSSVRPTGRVVGVPKRCWCGDQIIAKISKSDNNPYRSYYRCAYAVLKKLVNDNHAFKWVDEALLDEIETLQNKTVRLEEMVKEIMTERVEVENKVFEKLEMKLEKEIFERVEEMKVESRDCMKKMSVFVVMGCMIMFGLMKVVG